MEKEKYKYAEHEHGSPYAGLYNLIQQDENRVELVS